jgi:hypothetical protein
MDETEPVVYRINDRDEIVFVNPQWDVFAAANDGERAVSARVLGRSLWDFVSDSGTRQLYRDLLVRARTRGPLRFNYRCDSPALRRVMEMELVPAPGGGVEFRSRALTVEPRPPQALLDPGADRGGVLVRVCGWCKKVAVGGTWVEVDRAVTALGLLEHVPVPSLTHGICGDCLDGMKRTLGPR